jgi:hypothetical protein
MVVQVFVLESGPFIGSQLAEERVGMGGAPRPSGRVKPVEPFEHGGALRFEIRRAPHHEFRVGRGIAPQGSLIVNGQVFDPASHQSTDKKAWWLDFTQGRLQRDCAMRQRLRNGHGAPLAGRVRAQICDALVDFPDGFGFIKIFHGTSGSVRLFGRGFGLARLFNLGLPRHRRRFSRAIRTEPNEGQFMGLDRKASRQGCAIR